MTDEFNVILNEGVFYRNEESLKLYLSEILRSEKTFAQHDIMQDERRKLTF